MSLPLRLSSGSHALHLSHGVFERLSLIERLLANIVETGRRIVAVVDPELRTVFETVARLAHVRARQLRVHVVDELVDADADWQKITAAIDDAVQSAEREVIGWRRDDPESETLLFVDLDHVFARCNAASEMMSVIYSLHHNHAAKRRCVVEAISIDVIPRSIPGEFFDVHGDWVFSDQTLPVSENGEALDAAAQRVALQTPEFRNQFLALARTDTEGALRLVPRLFSDYRRGFLVVDQRFIVRHCSPRAASLLRRSIDDVVDRPLNTCIDGVDLLTLKHECVRVSSGTQSPFVVSWRIAPGTYEPREVSVDVLTSEHRPVGYVVSIAPVQNVRGPRAVYRQLTEEQEAESVAVPDDEEPGLEDALSDSLQGTQITKREHQVLLHILNRHSNRDIARQLNIAEVTVKKHLTSIYRKLRITNRAELIRSFEAPHAGATHQVGASE